MDRHWTLDLVATLGMCAGFALFATGSGAPLAGVVAAGSAYALLVPDLAASGRLADQFAQPASVSAAPQERETPRRGPTRLPASETAH